MLRGLGKLTWIEIKVFLREPLGAIGSVVVPVLLFVVMSRVPGLNVAASSPIASGHSSSGLPVLLAIVIAISAVLSLVTIISIYREGGILKRLRATPLRPHTILTAHVAVKLMLSAATLLLMLLVGRHYVPAGVSVRWFSFTIALMISTLSILSIGFLIASIVPTARFAQPIGGVILYPMIALSALFVPVHLLPMALRIVVYAMPINYAVHLLQGIWSGDPWGIHLGDIAALALIFLVCTTVSAKVFRWE